MKSSKTFNNISQKLLSQIPKLKPGQSAVFKMLNGVPNPDPDEKERSKDPILYPKMQLLTQYRLYDPYQLNDQKEEVGGYVDVGCVESWKGDEPIAFRCFVAGVNEGVQTPSRFQGKFELRGGNIRDEELYEVLWLSPQRKGTPCPDAAVEQVFEIQDLQAEVKHSNIKFEKLKKAIEYSDKISGEKAAQIFASLNQVTYQDPDILLSKIKEFARTNTDEFIAAYESEETPKKALVKSALDRGVITHNFATGEVKMGNVLLTTITIATPDDFLQEFTKWVSVSPNGKDVLANITNRVNAVKEEIAV